MLYAYDTLARNGLVNMCKWLEDTIAQVLKLSNSTQILAQLIVTHAITVAQSCAW